jgi:Carboxypeptidase regulatory-like domain
VRLKYSLIAFLISAAIQLAECAMQTIQGIVTDSVTGAGVPNVAVTLEGRDTYRATSGPDGTYRVKGVAEGQYRATFAATGYVAPDLKTRVTQAFRVSSVPSRLNVQLVPAAALSGRLIDPDDKPIGGAEVTLEVFGDIAAQAVTTEPVGGALPGLALAGASFTQSVTTSADGLFQFNGISPGSYRLHAAPPANLKPPASREGQALGWVRSFYRGAADANSAAEIGVAAGSKLTGQDIRLRPVPVYQLRGVVTTPAGAPAAGAQLRIAPDDEMRPREIAVRSNADGSFSFRTIHDGGWRLSASSKRAGKELKAFKWIHVAGRDTGPIAMRLGAPFTIHGTIEVPGNPESPGGCVVLAPEEGGQDSIQSCGGTREFTVANVFRRSFWIQPLNFPTFRMNDYYLASIAIGDRDTMGKAVELRPDSPPLRIVFKEGGGTLAGTVVNCGPATSVVAIPQEAALRQNIYYRLIRRASCGAGGRFRIPNMRPGSYYAFALEHDRPQPTEFTDLDQSLVSRATSVDIREAESQTVELRIISR